MYYNINKRDKHLGREVRGMREYRTVEEIREEAKQGNIARYKKFAKMFDKQPSMEISSMMSDLAIVLIKSYGLTPAEVEELEY